MTSKPTSVQVGLDLKLIKIQGTWQPNDAERKAAWELYVELITRVSVVQVPIGQGLLREALTSLYALFDITRDVLRKYGPDVAEAKPGGQYSFGYLAVAILNFSVRPLLVRWHPELEEWEGTRSPTTSRRVHEEQWPQAGQLREDLESARASLTRWTALLAKVNNIPDLSLAVPAAHP